MAQALVPGIKGSAAVLASDANTAAKFASGTIDVFATPAMIALMEEAAVKALTPYLAPGESSVGIMLNVRHTAATPVGMHVRATAELVEIAGRRLVFEVTAFDDKEQIGSGRHERFLIQTEAFMKKALAKKECH